MRIINEFMENSIAHSEDPIFPESDAEYTDSRFTVVPSEAPEIVEQPEVYNEEALRKLAQDLIATDRSARIFDIAGRPIIDEDHRWQIYAECLGSDQKLFFPEKNASTKKAKEMCNRCTVREQCLQYAIDNHEKIGVWAGVSDHTKRSKRPIPDAPSSLYT